MFPKTQAIFFKASAAAVGWLYCFLWISSILAGYASLFCPLLPVVFFSNRLYRLYTDVLFSFWQFYPTALLEILCGCDIQVTGDPIQTGETSVLIMNHRTRTDWNFFWPTVYHGLEGANRLAHSTKFVLKDVIKHIPGPGWVMQLACFVFIKRRWWLDKGILQRYVNHVVDISYKHSILVFPEGTDLTEETKKSSDDFAERNSLQKYEHVLHPRTTGFIFLAHQLLSKNNLDAIYDVTLVYPDVVPQTEKVLFNGGFPKEVKVHFARYSKTVLPKTKEGLKVFLQRRWLDKERTIKEFKSTGQFLHGRILRTEKRWELYLALVFWTLLPYLTLYFFVALISFRIMLLTNTFFLLLVSYLFGGFQNFEIVMYNLVKTLGPHKTRSGVVEGEKTERETD